MRLSLAGRVSRGVCIRSYWLQHHPSPHREILMTPPRDIMYITDISRQPSSRTRPFIALGPVDIAAGTKIRPRRGPSWISSLDWRIYSAHPVLPSSSSSSETTETSRISKPPSAPRTRNMEMKLRKSEHVHAREWCREIMGANIERAKASDFDSSQLPWRGGVEAGRLDAQRGMFHAPEGQDAPQRQNSRDDLRKYSSCTRMYLFLRRTNPKQEFELATNSYRASWKGYE
ncbi:hypothetical protein BOTBODRAFT_418401 [Botryobasidium botryosum FD-172 SS1]|uniref:Uncharacterized protein n=1 Tax=Botryobasidium botryosum (strain FD-172 SS1) TaxID=930990 RepID=A0A067M9H1_BOTB1|nr:hypothetical protein BOTBODRAFT_418401 [Botryobasidium botryosum FD-172 SS1]